LASAYSVCAYTRLSRRRGMVEKSPEPLLAAPSPSGLRPRPASDAFRQGFRPARSFGGSNSLLSPPATSHSSQLRDEAPP